MQIIKTMKKLLPNSHCVKRVRIRSYSGPYSVQMPENTDQNNSEYAPFLRSVNYNSFFTTNLDWRKIYYSYHIKPP